MLTSIERMHRALRHQSTDRIPIAEHFWGDTYKKWLSEGKVLPHQTLCQHFDLDVEGQWTFKMVADLDYVPQVIAEDEDTVTLRDGNGAVLRRHKKHDTTPEHIDFLVKERKDWEEHIKYKLKPDVRRMNLQGYRDLKERARQDNRFFMWEGVGVFESIFPVCGHENMLVGMALDPDWITDMAQSYADLIIGSWEMLFEKEGKPDGLWLFEDMGFKERPFMSPAMYSELILPAHKRLVAAAHSFGLPVIMHSCGFIEPLLPHMIQSGIDALQAMEVKAGMDLLRIYKNFGDKIALMGGIDVRSVISNDKVQMDEELSKKIPTVKKGHGYIFHSDHSIPNQVEYESYRYFIEKAKELGTN